MCGRFDWQPLHDPFVAANMTWVGAKGVRVEWDTKLGAAHSREGQQRGTIGIGPTDEDGEPEIFLHDKVTLQFSNNTSITSMNPPVGLKLNLQG
jgi:hypothetical protein